MKRWLLCLIAGLTCLGLSTTARADDVADAKQAAGEWLRLLDDGNFIESYRTASASFRQAVSETVWVRTMRAMREPLDKVDNRTLMVAKDASALSGAPPAHYVVLQFGTQFSGKKMSSVETVTPVQEADGKWRVSGYFVN